MHKSTRPIGLNKTEHLFECKKPVVIYITINHTKLPNTSKLR
jgi:hypothetical protein